MSSASAGTATGRRKLGNFLEDIAPFFYRTSIVYVDVGAHHGETFREMFLSDVNIHEAHLVVPNPVSFARLRETVRELDMEAVTTCHQLALSDAPKRLRLRDAGSMTKILETEAELLPEERTIQADATHSTRSRGGCRSSGSRC